MMESKQKIELENARVVASNGFVYSDCDVDCVIKFISDRRTVLTRTEIEGEIEFRHIQVSRKDFFNKHGKPLQLKVISETDIEQLQLESFIVTGTEDNKLNFVAETYEYTVFNR